MAEYINRNALLESIRSGEGTNEHKIFAALCVSNAPAADVAKVVRCKDCVHYEPHGNGKRGTCRIPRCKGLRWYNDYCSYGERGE